MMDIKIMTRIANCILHQLGQLHQEYLIRNQSRLGSFCEKLENIQKDRHFYSIALQHHWRTASDRIQTRTIRNISDLNSDIQTLKEHLDQKIPKIPSASDIVAELIQLEDEYGQLQYNPEEKTLSVNTDSIELEEVCLGSFEIRLHLNMLHRLDKGSPYYIIALEPNPAAASNDITHPHVSNEILCEGDGTILIRKALEQGRLADFFSLVVGILNTYNSSSPYVALDEWQGSPCYDCGYIVNREESYFCEHCQNDYCSQCSSYCKICETTTCFGCLTECPDCNDPVCKDCYGTCRDCEREVCQDCLEEGLCYVCIENRKDNENEETIQIPKNPVPAVQPDGMGKTRVSA